MVVPHIAILAYVGSPWKATWRVFIMEWNGTRTFCTHLASFMGYSIFISSCSFTNQLVFSLSFLIFPYLSRILSSPEKPTDRTQNLENHNTTLHLYHVNCLMLTHACMCNVNHKQTAFKTYIDINLCKLLRLLMLKPCPVY